ncbi:MAG: LysR substrate-binding domain-containing protein [Actinomycetota bacterium]|jgi:LysR family hydrogen peroxide-inducible transcriptional activator|nr:LysR substrate-binding domain-containing protein [Actinomycetota bacterium]
MELRHLQALVAITDAGSFSAAADRLGTVQSNISAHVARLEAELGTTLLDRATGRLTDEGTVVVARARRMLSELEALVADVAAYRDQVTGTVRVGMIGTTARWLVPELLRLIDARHPGVHLVVVEGTTTGLEPRLEAGQLDVAVLNLPVPGRDVVTTPLFEEDLVLVVPVEHPLASHPGALPVADLDGLELLLPAHGTAYRDELDAAIAPAGVTLTPRAEIDGLRLIASLTFEGYGPAILPATALPRILGDRFRGIPIAGLPRRRVGTALRARGLPSAPTRVLLELLAGVVARRSDLPGGLHTAS